NRTLAEIRHVLSRCGGNMAEVGSVSWQFKHVCYFSLPAENANFDKVFELAVENGADDITNEGEYIEIFGPVDNYKEINDRLKEAGFEPDESDLRFLPKQEIGLETDKTLKVMQVIESLEELDDVQSVYSNLEISEEALAALETE
ncbi:MAG: YebC/PmpR family DNA-binding transcriptional regulator, partial [Anaerolineaceae bacterium]|nr:YebC/PmpR family DNA-binding transcriptional regulator [Anaerolineaceae bacterium]